MTDSGSVGWGFESLRVHIFDFNNRQILSSIKINSNQKLTINIKNVDEGVYFLRITGEQFQAIRKVVMK